MGERIPLMVEQLAKYHIIPKAEKGGDLTSPIFSDIDSILEKARASTDEYEISDFRAGSDLRGDLWDTIQHMEATDPDTFQTTIMSLLDRYTGEENETRWSAINADAIYEVCRGDDLIAQAIIEKIKNTDAVDPIFVQTLFEKVSQQLLERLKMGRGQNSESGEYYYDEFEQLGTEEEGTHLEDAPNDEIWLLNKAIRELGSRGNEETISALIDIVQTEGSWVTKHVAYALSSIDAEKSAEQLLAITRGGDEYDRRTAARVLYRLETGKINISERGANYLGRLYDLGIENDPTNFAQRLTPHGEVGVFDDNNFLKKYFTLGDLSDRDKQRTVELLDVTLELLFRQVAPAGSPEREEQEQILQEFQEKYFSFFESDFFDRTGVSFNNFSFREQAWFMKFVISANEEKQEQVRKFVAIYGEPALKCFISTEFDRAAGDKLLALADQIPEQAMRRILTSFDNVLVQAEYQSIELAREYQDDLGLSEDSIYEGLTVRAKDILLTAERRISAGENAEAVVAETIRYIEKEIPREQIISGRFRNMAELLARQPSDTVDIRERERDLQIVIEQDQSLFMQALSSRGELRPVPEIFWKVDRGSEEYQKRFGIDINQLLLTLSEEGKKRTLVEFGPGSGKHKSERADLGIPKHYVDVAIADSVYYPMDKMVASMFDWGKLEESLGQKISEDDRHILEDMLYKMVMIKDGETAKDDFEYASSRIDQITRDPNNLKKILPTLGPRITNVNFIPNDYAEFSDGRAVYPEKVDLASDKERTKTFLEAKSALAENISKYLRDDIDSIDLYQHVPAYAAGVMVSDFDGIQSIKDGQIDVAIGVRSTVYKEGEGYKQFLGELLRKLSNDCLYIDDNVRENFGRRYRIAELVEVQERWDKNNNDELDIRLIVGPGVEGEDDNKGDVPQGLLIQKEADYSPTVESMMQEGYRLVKLKDYLEQLKPDNGRVGIIDNTGQLNTVVERLAA